MRSKAWITLLQSIPPDKFEKLMLVSQSGNEVTIQNIVRIEEEYMVVNARLAGTTDDPRVMLIPLDNIDYLGFREPLKNAEIEEIFGRGLGLDGLGAPAPRPSALAPQAAARELEGEAAPAEAAEVAAAEEPVKKQRPAALSALLRPAAAPEQPAPTPPPAPEPAAPAASEGGLLPGKAALLERLRKSRQGQK